MLTPTQFLGRRIFSSVIIFNLFLVTAVREYPKDVFFVETGGKTHVLLVVLLKHDGMLVVALVGVFPCPTQVSAAVGCGCLTQFLRQLPITLFARGSQRKVEGVERPLGFRLKK